MDHGLERVGGTGQRRCEAHPDCPAVLLPQGSRRGSHKIILTILPETALRVSERKGEKTDETEHEGLGQRQAS